MKKYFYMAVAAIVAFISCSKEESPVNDGTAGDGLVFTATIEQNADTRTVLNGNKVNWVLNDRISINGKIFTATSVDGSNATIATFEGSEVSPVDGKYKAYYPASVYNYGDPALPAEQTYVAGSISNLPMYAETEGNSLVFKNLCGVLAIKVTSADIATLKSIRVSSGNHDMSGVFTVTENAAVLSDDKSGINMVELISNEALTLTPEGTIFYIAVPAGTYPDIIIELSSDTNNYTSAMRTKSNSVTIARNKIYSIDYAENAPAALPGVFSVSSTRQVRFSRGNLWCNSSMNNDRVTWNFEMNQYDFPVKWNSHHVGHFFWTNDAEKSYLDFYDQENVIDQFFANGNSVMGAGWFVLSEDEWRYLVDNTRNKQGLATVCGVKGLVILPDNWSGNNINSSYTAAAWLSMEEAGAVFLPVAGNRIAGEIGGYNDDYYQYYWSCTPYNEKEAIAVAFEYDHNLWTNNQERTHPYPIRMVTEVLQQQ